MSAPDPLLARRLATLREVASIPTAPLHEAGVARHIVSHLRRRGLVPRRDRWGNLIVRYSRGTGRGPALALVAHMDHPALELASVEAPDRAAATLLGGVAAACFRRPVPVRLYPTGGGEGIAGEVVGHEEVAPRQVTLQLRLDGPAAPGDFGVFDFPAYRAEGDIVHLRAADDLVGCAAILLVLDELAGAGAEATVYGVFTRAEEVGLAGATLLAADGTLPRDALIVSLEASKELPGAVMGQGPVIRVGDRARTFDAAAEAALLAARERLAAAGGGGVQRQLMSGGTCEATAFGLAGYRATGVALPLGNYHNVGPGDVLAAEYVSARDFSTEVDLLVAAALGGAPAEAAQARLAESAARYRDRLADTAAQFE